MRVTNGVLDAPVALASVATSGSASDLAVGTLPIGRIADADITLAKIQQITSGRILGRLSAGDGVCEQLTSLQAKQILEISSADVAGLGSAALLPSSAFAAAAHTHVEDDVVLLVADLAAKQPLDATLTALAGLSITAGLLEQTGVDAFTKRAIGVANATDVLTRGDGDGRFAQVSHTHPESDVTNLTADLAAKQPLDATLTALAALSASAGLLEQTGADAFTKRAIGVAAATDILTRADGDGRFAPISAAAPTYARCSADRTTTGQALADIADLLIALLANSVYEFEAILMVASSSTAGNQYGVQFSTAGASVEAQISGTLAAATSRSDRISVLNTATPSYVTVAAAGGIRIQGILTTGVNAGNLTIRHLKVTSGTSTVRARSYLKSLKIA